MNNKTKVLVISLVMLAVTLAFLIIQSNALSKPDSNGLFKLIQGWRKTTYGITYKESLELCYFAEMRLHQLPAEESHAGFNAMTQNIFDATGFHAIAENFATLRYDNFETLTGWLGSPSHRENLDHLYTHTCVKCADRTCVQLFGEY